MDEETLRHVARIARIHLSPEEEALYLSQFDEIFSLMERVKDVTLEGELEGEIVNPLREDRPERFNEDLTHMFPKKRERYLEVPKNI